MHKSSLKETIQGRFGQGIGVDKSIVQSRGLFLYICVVIFEKR